jgi:hypothetical protein
MLRVIINTNFSTSLSCLGDSVKVVESICTKAPIFQGKGHETHHKNVALHSINAWMFWYERTPGPILQTLRLRPRYSNLSFVLRILSGEKQLDVGRFVHELKALSWAPSQQQLQVIWHGERWRPGADDWSHLDHMHVMNFPSLAWQQASFKTGRLLKAKRSRLQSARKWGGCNRMQWKVETKIKPYQPVQHAGVSPRALPRENIEPDITHALTNGQPCGWCWPFEMLTVWIADQRHDPQAIFERSAHASIQTTERELWNKRGPSELVKEPVS